MCLLFLFLVLLFVFICLLCFLPSFACLTFVLFHIRHCRSAPNAGFLMGVGFKVKRLHLGFGGILPVSHAFFCRSSSSSSISFLLPFSTNLLPPSFIYFHSPSSFHPHSFSIPVLLPPSFVSVLHHFLSSLYLPLPLLLRHSSCHSLTAEVCSGGRRREKARGRLARHRQDPAPLAFANHTELH